MLKTRVAVRSACFAAYHLGEGRVLKTWMEACWRLDLAYHLGEGRVLKTNVSVNPPADLAYHLGEGRVLKTGRTHALRTP